jgi:hypothetical protein
VKPPIRVVTGLAGPARPGCGVPFPVFAQRH